MVVPTILTGVTNSNNYNTPIIIQSSFYMISKNPFSSIISGKSTINPDLWNRPIRGFPARHGGTFSNGWFILWNFRISNRKMVVSIKYMGLYRKIPLKNGWWLGVHRNSTSWTSVKRASRGPLEAADHCSQAIGLLLLGQRRLLRPWWIHVCMPY